MEAALIAAGVILAGYGALALLATWRFPGWLETPLFGTYMLLGRLPPTRVNRTLMAAWSLFFGGYIALAMAGLRTASYIAFALWLPLALVVIIRQFRGGR